MGVWNEERHCRKRIFLRERPETDFNDICIGCSIEHYTKVIALAAEFEMILNQYDVTAAYLNGRFKEAVFMKSLNGRTLERIVIVVIRN